MSFSAGQVAILILFVFALFFTIGWIIYEAVRRPKGQIMSTCSGSSSCEPHLVCDSQTQQCKIPRQGHCTSSVQCVSTAPYCVGATGTTGTNMSSGFCSNLAPFTPATPGGATGATGANAVNNGVSGYRQAVNYNGMVIYLSPDGSQLTANNTRVYNNIVIDSLQVSNDQTTLYAYSQGRRYQLVDEHSNRNMWIWM